MKVLKKIWIEYFFLLVLRLRMSLWHCSDISLTLILSEGNPQCLTLEASAFHWGKKSFLSIANLSQTVSQKQNKQWLKPERKTSLQSHEHHEYHRLQPHCHTIAINIHIIINNFIIIIIILTYPPPPSPQHFSTYLVASSWEWMNEWMNPNRGLDLNWEKLFFFSFFFLNNDTGYFLYLSYA